MAMDQSQNQGDVAKIMQGMAAGQSPGQADIKGILGQAASMTGNEDKMRDLEKLITLAEHAKKNGDIESAII